MHHLAAWFQSNLEIVDLLHALAFLVIGVAVLVQPKRREPEPLTLVLPWFVAYVLVRAASDLVEFLFALKGGGPVLPAVGLATTFLSYLLVFEFGRRLHNASRRAIPGWSTGAIAAAVLVASVSTADPHGTADVLIGWLFRLPAGVLMASGFRGYFSARRERLDPLGCRDHFHAASAISILWGLLGMFRGEAAFFPAAWLNERTFLEVTGFPVQLARTLCGVGMVFPILGILRALNREMVEELERSREGLERRLGDVERRFSELVEQSLVGIYILHGERFAYANPRLAEMWGVESGESLVGRSTMEFIVPEDRETVRENIRKRMTGELRSIKYTLKVRRPDGEIRAFEVHGSYAEIGGEPAIIGTMLDITERLKSEEALRRSEERYAMAVRGSNDGIWDWDVRTGQIHFSPRCREMLGYGSVEIENHIDEWKRRIHPEDFERVFEAIDAHVSGRVPHLEVAYRLRHRDGGWRWVLGRGISLPGPDGRPARLAGSLTDLTERKRLEEQLLQAQKMEAVGRLAGGIAHDFNNLLTAILGYCELLQARIGPGDPARRDVEEIGKAGERAASLTRQLLAFSRRQLLQPRVLDPNEFIRGMDEMLRRLIGENVELETRTEPGIPNVRIDPGQLGQVLVNLVVNGRDAMPGGGRLLIETASVTRERFAASAEGWDDLRLPAVMIAVSDTGIGMDEATQARIFEPFFTTKEVGKGTGLGLSTSYGIVRQSGGRIVVESSPGNGSTFRLFFPAVAGPASEAEPMELAAPARAEGGTVLVVEDEAAVRTLVCETLVRAGYRVLAASDGREGLAVAGGHPGEIAVVLTDIVMPRMGGPEMADRLAEARPGIRVVLMSGYSEEEATRQGSLSKGREYLQKPFRPEALVRKVREAAGSRA
jgi:PAS domain S-box-containing protein